MLSRSAVTLFVSATLVAGHGLVTDVVIGGQRYVGTKNWDAPENKNSPVRRLPQDTGFVDYHTVTNSMDIACSSAGYKGTPVVAPMNAGDQIKIRWGGDQGADKKQWPHCEGYETAYLAPCTNGDCTTFSPNEARWTKISESGLDPSKPPQQCPDGHMAWGDGRWAQNLAQSDDSWFTVTIPKDTKSGQYLFRHELVSLQDAKQRGAQYYPACMQIEVKNGGANAFSNGIPATQMYKVEDGIVNIYEPYSKGIKSYKVPGPAVYAAGKAEKPTPAPAPASSTPQPTATTSTTPPPSPPAAKPGKMTTSKSPAAAAAPTPKKKTCKPKKAKRSLADETRELYERDLAIAQARHAHAAAHKRHGSF